MNGRILGSVRTFAVCATQHLPRLPTFRSMSVSIQGNDLTPVISAMRDLLSRIASYTTSVLTLAKGLLSVVYAAADLARLALATVIKNVVGARGSRFMKNAWDVICRLKALNFDARSLSGSTGTPSASSGWTS